MKVIASIALLVLLSAAMVYTAQAAGKGRTADPSEFPVVMEDGTNAGVLVLGKTAIRESIRMFPRPPKDYKGNPQRPRNYPPVQVGEHIPKPVIVYAPYKSRYVLYFDRNEKLVIVQDTASEWKGRKKADVIKRYPEMKETNRSEKAYEMQGQAAPCITALFLFDNDDDVIQVAFAYTCLTKQ